MGTIDHIPTANIRWRSAAKAGTWALLLLLAGIASGLASMNRESAFPLHSIIAMAAGLVLGVTALAIRPRTRPLAILETVLTPILAIATIVYCALQYVYFPPGRFSELKKMSDLSSYWMLSAAIAALAGMCIFAPLRKARVAFALLLVGFALNGIWIIVRSPVPVIDVWVVHQAACEAVAHGVNPYAITYPNAYRAGSQYMDTVEIKDDMVQAGYPYPPMTLMMAYPGWRAFGDSRYSDLAAMVLTAVILACIDRKRIGLLLGMLLLVMPMSLFVIEQNWTESHVLLLLAATAWCCVHRPGLVPWILGLFLASKQHLFMTIPVAILLMPYPRDPRSIVLFFAKAFIAAAVVTLPWYLWNPSAFAHSALRMFSGSLGSGVVPRTDSTTFWAVLNHYGLGELPGIASPAAAAILTVLALARQWRSQLAGTAGLLAIALVVMSLFAFSRHGFCNHYYFVFGAMLCALATYSAQCSTDTTEHAVLIAGQ